MNNTDSSQGKSPPPLPFRSSRVRLFLGGLFVVIIVLVFCLVPRRSSSTGSAGSALNFDGMDDYVVLTNEKAFNFTGPFTVEAWIKVRNFTKDWQTIIAKGDTSWRLARNGDMGNTNAISFGTTGLSNQDLPGTSNVNDGQWHHVAAVFTGSTNLVLIEGLVDGAGRSIRAARSTKLLYVDGVLEASTNVLYTLVTNDSHVCIGENEEVPGRQFSGWIDEVRIWTTARNASEISTNKNRTLTGQEDGLYAYYRFDEGSGTTVRDSGRAGQNGKLMHGPTWTTSTAPLEPPAK